MEPSEFMNIVEDIRSSAFSVQAWLPSKEKRSNNITNEEFLSYTWYLQQMIVYKTLKYGIKNRDIMSRGQVEMRYWSIEEKRMWIDLSCIL